MIDGSVLQSAQRCFEKKSRVVVKMVVKIVEIVIHYLSILRFFLQAKILVETFSLKYFLKSRTFTENLLVNFYICYFHFLSLFFRPWSLVAFEGGRGVGGKDGGGQNWGLWVEKREGGVREVEKRAGRKS